MNNTGILQKCLDELNKETFRKDYVIGMLETLINMQDFTHQSEPLKIVLPPHLISSANGTSDAPDEGAVLDAKAKAAIATIQAMGGTNTPE